MKDFYVIPVFIPHIGCPNKCVFCNQTKITGFTKRLTREDVFKEVDEFLATIKNKNASIELAFFGGSFTGIDVEYQIELLKAGKELIDQGKIHYIRLSTRPDYINEEILDRLKEYGVKVIELGVQSMDEEVLEVSLRGHSAEDVCKASRLIREHGFTLGHQMMIGLPKDSYEKSISTAKQLIKLKPDIVRIYPVLVIKDTDLEIMFKNKTFTPLSLEDAVKWSKDLLLLFEANGIKVIRVGLQKTESVAEGEDVIGGPFHPAFRELVESEIFLDMFTYCLDKLDEDSRENVLILVNSKEISKALGNKKSNIIQLKGLYNVENIQIKSSEEVRIKNILVKSVDNDIFLSKSFFIKSFTKRRKFDIDVEEDIDIKE